MEILSVQQQLQLENDLLRQENERLRRENVLLQQKLKRAKTIIEKLEQVVRKHF